MISDSAFLKKKHLPVFVKLAMYIFVSLVFAGTWGRMFDKLAPWQLVSFALLLLFFWLSLSQLVFRFLFVKEGVDDPLKFGLYSIIAFLLSLPLFAVWDATSWVIVTGYNDYNNVLNSVIEDTPILYYMQCFLYYSIFTILTILGYQYSRRRNNPGVEPDNTLKSESERMKRELKPIITITAAGEKKVVKIDAIIRIEANRYYSRIYQVNREHLIRESLDSLEEKLVQRGFKRVHRSHIINLSFLDRLIRKPPATHIAILTNGEEISVSRSRLQELKESLASMESH